MSPFRLVKNKLFLVGILVFLQLLLISYQIPLGGKQTLLEKLLLMIFAPVQKVAVGSYKLVIDSWEKLSTLKRVQEENQVLRKEIFFLKQQNQLLQEKLRLSLGRIELEKNLELISNSVITARIIGFDPANYFRSAVINKGTADGLVKNLPVCDKYGQLVGRVAEPVGQSEARVILITSEESGVAVITNSDRTPGILSGDGQGRCLIKYVMASSPLGVEGDEVQTSGFDRVFPPGLRVGRIIQVSTKGGIFKKIVVKPYFDIRELELVAVLKNTNLILR